MSSSQRNIITGRNMELQDTIRRILREESRFTIDTKVVDSKGSPLVMYHGGSYTGGEFKGNTWFTSSKTDAKYYAKQNYGVVTKAYLIVNKPLYSGNIRELNIKVTNEIISSIKRRGLTGVLLDENYISFIETNDGVLLANDIGKDGVIDIHNGKILDVVVFDNKQIILI